MESLDGANFSKVFTIEDFLGRALKSEEKRKKSTPEKLHVKGPMQIPIPRPAVSIVGSRKASPQGIENAKRIAKELVKQGVVIISGLAEGIDTAAHKSAIDNGGKTIAVLGTPLNKVYPKKNSWLQEEIMRNHLAISQFPEGHITFPNDFVARNMTMALISDATIIVEATETSGSRHQGWETIRLRKPLFIWESILRNPKSDEYKEMLSYREFVRELSDPSQVLEVLR